MENKIKTDSWVDNVEIKDENFLGRKTLDYSSFSKGTTIPIRYHEKFLNCISVTLKRGDRVKVKLFIEDIEYNGVLRWPNAKDRKGITIQLIYSQGKKIEDILKRRCKISYEYIMNYYNDRKKKPTVIPDEYKEYIDFYKGDEVNSFIMKLITKDEGGSEEDEFVEEEEDDFIDEINEMGSIKDEVHHVYNYIRSKGFYYDESLIKNLYISLRTRPFVILSGISGTGKSKLIELFAEAIGANHKNRRFNLIPVKPDWSDATDILGYRNIEGRFIPGIIVNIAYEAMKNLDKPYFICLDEMNLARVEYYFSDILSLMEGRNTNLEGEIITKEILSKEQFGSDMISFEKYGDVYIPENLYIIGTVNMDETTFQFSKKVLDRANVIEFNKVELRHSFEDLFLDKVNMKRYNNDFLKSHFLKIGECEEYKELVYEIIDKLVEINSVLEEYNQQFAFRVRDEIVFYIIYAREYNLLEFDEAFDNCIVQKILPKLNGNSNDIQEILIKLFNLFNGTNIGSDDYLGNDELQVMNKCKATSKYKLASEKIIYMLRRFMRDGFTTFWQ